MNAATLRKAVAAISAVMNENRMYLIELDQQNGDGDLGISMSDGFAAVSAWLEGAEESDLGKLLMKCGLLFNEAAPSTLGTILSFGFLGMGKTLKGVSEADFGQFTEAFAAGVESIMARAGARPGEKTILDALVPAAEALKGRRNDPAAAVREAAKAAADGSEATRAMRAVHGRAAYYGDRSVGVLDGGSAAGKLILEGIARCCGQGAGA